MSKTLIEQLLRAAAVACSLSSLVAQNDSLRRVLSRSSEREVLVSDTSRSTWILRFAERSFDLSALRESMLNGGTADARRKMLETVQQSMARDQQEAVLFVDKLGGTVLAQYWILNGMAVEIPQEFESELEKVPGVERLDRSHVLRVSGRGIEAFSTAPTPIDTSAQLHGVRSVQASGVFGQGQYIAFVDSGAASPYLNTGRDHAIFFEDPVALTNDLLDPVIQVGAVAPNGLNASHGTAVISIAAGSTWPGAINAGIDGRGQAPSARKRLYSVSDDLAGGAMTSTLVTAWQQLLADHLVASTPFDVADVAYSSRGDIDAPDQVAMDTAMFVGNLFVSSAAGDRFPTPMGNSFFGVLTCVEPVANAGAGRSKFVLGSQPNPCNRNPLVPWWANGQFQIGDMVESEGFDLPQNNGVWRVVDIQTNELIVEDIGNVIADEDEPAFTTFPRKRVLNLNPVRFSAPSINGMAVGGTDIQKRWSQFSVAGPLPQLPTARFPDMVAVGEFSRLPNHLDENAVVGFVGTSGSAPHVAGAAALVTQVDPLLGSPNQLTALEKKAILLASCEDISGSNVGLSFPGNEIGAGFLRTDKAVEIARNRYGNVRSAVADATTNFEFEYPINVRQGENYRFVLCWERDPSFTGSNWANFQLRLVTRTGGVLSTVTHSLPVARVVDFVAPETGRMWIRVNLLSLQPGTSTQRFALAHNGDLDSGAFDVFGSGCAGSGVPLVDQTVPSAQATSSGNSGFEIDGPVDFAQIMASSTLPAGPVAGMRLRFDDVAPGNPFFSGGDIELEVRVGPASDVFPTLPPPVLPPSANMISGRSIQVASRRWVRIQPAIQSQLSAREIFIPFNLEPRVGFPLFAGFPWTVFVRVFNVRSEQPIRFDGVMGSQASGVVNFAYQRSGQTGVASVSRGLVIEFETRPAGTGASPRIGLRDRSSLFAPFITRLPAVGRTFDVVLEQAEPGSIASLFAGFSNTMAGGVPLPISLAALGAPGCLVFTSGEASAPGPLVNSRGQSLFPFVVPMDPSFIGVPLYLQWVATDSGAPGGIVVSNAAAAIAGTTDYEFVR